MARYNNAEYADMHVMEILELHPQNTNLGIQNSGNPTHAFVTVHCSLTKIRAFIPPAHVGHARRNVQDKEDMLNAVHANQSASTWNTSQIAGWLTTRVKQLYPLHVQSVQRLQPGDINVHL
jgi:hypothetical protein